MRLQLPLLFALACLNPCILSAQTRNAQGKEFEVGRALDKIVLDGELTEQTWLNAVKGQDFFMSKPIDSIAPFNQTFFQIAFDDENLYVAFECMDDGGVPIVQSLRRDFEFRENDNVGIYFYPFNDYTNGVYFNVMPYGVQREGLIVNGGSVSGDYSSFWDNKWYSGAKRYDNRWIVELAIPLKSIRYNRDTWHFNVLRNDMERNEVSSWVATPYQYLPASANWSGKIVWKDPLPKPGLNVSLIPYVAGSVIQDKEHDQNAEGDGSFGFDAKVGLSASLNLDLTYNPDFSQVEVDRQVINLTRFEVNFPERRQFFLENSDLFSQPGFPDSRPFFSRRIGLANDSTSALKKVPILYGARVSGKIGNDWRIGLMNLQTKEEKSLGLPAQNYSVGVVQRQIFSRSNIGLVFINKQSLGLGSEYDQTKFYHHSVIHEEINGTDTVRSLNSYNRVGGIDFNFFSKDTRWRGDFYYHKSMDDFEDSDNNSTGGYLEYNVRKFTLAGGYMFLGKNFNAETGFVPNLKVYPGYNFWLMNFQYRFYPQSKTVANHGPIATANLTRLPSGEMTDGNYSAGYSFLFLNTAELSITANNTYQKLTSDFNPIQNEDGSFADFQTGEEFNWNYAKATFFSDQRKLFRYKLETSLGGFYSGQAYIATGELTYRYQPFGSFTVGVNYNDIRLPESYGKDQLTLISSRLDLTFTDKLFLTTFVQYNDKADNINLNARFQWRFKPASDLFVVYTENYLPDHLKSKNSALVVKLTYWFNL